MKAFAKQETEILQIGAKPAKGPKAKALKEVRSAVACASKQRRFVQWNVQLLHPAAGACYVQEIR